MPTHNFAPAAGTLTDVVLPGGCGVRVDSHAYTGLAVPPFYDSLLAKIVSHARDPREARSIAWTAALGETRIAGVNTTIGICRSIMRDGRFRAGGVRDRLPAGARSPRLPPTVLQRMTRRFAREARASNAL